MQLGEALFVAVLVLQAAATATAIAPVPTSEGIASRRAAAADSAGTLPAFRAGNHLVHFIGRQGDVSHHSSISPASTAVPVRAEPRCFMAAGPNGASLSGESGLYHKALK